MILQQVAITVFYRSSSSEYGFCIGPSGFLRCCSKDPPILILLQSIGFVCKLTTPSAMTSNQPCRRDSVAPQTSLSWSDMIRAALLLAAAGCASAFISTSVRASSREGILASTSENQKLTSLMITSPPWNYSLSLLVLKAVATEALYTFEKSSKIFAEAKVCFKTSLIPFP